MGQAIVTLPDGRKARVTFDSQEQLDAVVNDLVGAPKITGELPSERYLRETGQSIPQVSSNVPLQVAREGLRTLGSAGRDIAQGALALPAMIADSPGLIYNAGAELAGSNSRAPLPFTNAVRALDNPAIAPRTSTERVVSGVNQALSGAMAGVGVGQALTNSANAATANVGQQLAARPGMQAVSAATGATSAGIVREKGGGPAAQLAAGILGAAAPSVLESGSQALVRGTLRGAEEGRQTVARNIAAFADSGTTPTVGQATQSRVAQATESLLAKAPGSAGVMASKATTQANEIGSHIEDLAAQLSPAATSEQSGRAIARGLEGPGGFLENYRNQSSQLYAAIDQHIPQGTPVSATNTEQALLRATTPIQGAENTSRAFINPMLVRYRDALQADLQANNGQIPFTALRSLRTLVGEQLDNSAFGQSDVPTAELRRLYGALSSDIEAASQAAGPDAARAFTRANNYYRAGQQRIDVLRSVIDRNGGPEAIFKAATSGAKEGATTLRAVMQSLPQDAQQSVSATVLRRLGNAKAGAQNDLGDRFSTETFLTNWNSMSPEARGVLFNRYGAHFRENMDQIANVASNLRSGSKVFINPSGTGSAAAQYGTVGALVLAAMQGQVETAAAISGAMASANLNARLMTNPNFVQWLAGATRAPVEALPASINALAQQANKLDDPDMKALASELKAQSNRGP